MEELTKEEVRLVDDYRNGFLGVYWHIDDFEMKATSLEEGELKPIYDRTKFQDSLVNMIRQHDACLGITWDTIEVYLDEYCLIVEV